MSIRHINRLINASLVVVAALAWVAFTIPQFADEITIGTVFLGVAISAVVHFLKPDVTSSTVESDKHVNEVGRPALSISSVVNEPRHVVGYEPSRIVQEAIQVWASKPLDPYHARQAHWVESKRSPVEGHTENYTMKVGKVIVMVSAGDTQIKISGDDKWPEFEEKSFRRRNSLVAHRSTVH